MKRIAEIIGIVFGVGMLLFGAFIFSTWLALGINGAIITAVLVVAVMVVVASAIVWIVGAAESIAIRYGLVWQAMRRINAESRRQEREAESLRVVHPTGGVAISDRAGQWRYFQAGSAQVVSQKHPDPEPETSDDGPEIVGPLLPVLEGMSRILLIGGMGAGKTELLRHLAWSKSQQDGHVIICDSHASPTTWPDFVQVAGIGRNYPEIEGVVNYVCEELDNRYKLRSTGKQTRFEQLTLVVDELFVLNQFCDLKQQFKSLLAESRKVNIGLIVAGQSDRANAIGLSGNKDLVAGFEACVYLEQLDDGRRVGFIRSGNKKDGKYYLHPGPFAGRGRPDGSRMGTRVHGYTTDEDSENGPVFNSTMYHVPMYDTGATVEHADIIDKFRHGWSLNSICKRIFGSVGGKQAARIKSILAENGII